MMNSNKEKKIINQSLQQENYTKKTETFVKFKYDNVQLM